MFQCKYYNAEDEGCYCEDCAEHDCKFQKEDDPASKCPWYRENPIEPDGELHEDR